MAVVSNLVPIQALACMDWPCGGLLLKPAWRGASRRTKTGRTTPTQHLALYPSMSKKQEKKYLFGYYFSNKDSSSRLNLLFCIDFSLRRSDPVRQVLRVEQTGCAPKLLLVTANSVALVDGKHRQLLWRFNTSAILTYDLGSHSAVQSHL